VPEENVFEKLWEILPHPPGSVVRYSAILGRTNYAGDYAATWQDLELAAQEWEKDAHNFFVQMNPTEERALPRPTAKHISHWSWFLLDADPVAELFNPMAAIDEYLNRIRLMTGVTLKPTIIHSGRGAQAWIRLNDIPLDQDVDLIEEFDARGQPIPESERRVETMPARKMARRVMGWWLNTLVNEIGEVHGCLLDTSVSDLPRVMRCPGTVNQKTGRRALVADWGGHVHTDLHVKLIRQVPFATYAEAEPGVLPEGTPWQMVKAALTRTASRFIDRGQAEPGRHKAAVACAFSCKEQGLPPSETLKAMRYGNRKCQPKPLEEEDLKRIVGNVYKDEDWS
jgi:hypothetical protein